MISWVVINRQHLPRPGRGPRQAPQCRHVTKIPSPQLLYSPHLQNRDARNSFRFRSYAKWGVSPAFSRRSDRSSAAVVERRSRPGRDLQIEASLQSRCGDPDPVGTFQRADVFNPHKSFTCNNSGPQVLLLSKPKAPINQAESTLLQVLILKQLKVPLESITFEKQGGGYPLWLTKC
jgi:hypothetical protein